MWRQILIVPCFVLGGFVGLLCAQEGDGNYKQDNPAESLRKSAGDEAKVKAQVLKILKGEEPLDERSKVLFENYYNRFKFPMLTLSDYDSLKKLPDERLKFLRDHLEVGTSMQAHEHLLKLTIAYMVNVANDNYHPAVRFNAMYMIGLLNDQETVRLGPEKFTPEPCRAALEPLLAAFKKPDQFDLVRLAALTGLVRQIELDHVRATANRITDQARNELIAVFTALAKQSSPPEYRSEDGHLWMRIQAVEGLGHAVYPKAVPGIIATLDDVIGNSKEPVHLRVAAAQAMGRANWAGWTGPAKFDAAASLGRVSDLLADIFAAEKKRFELEQKQEVDLVGPLGPATAATNMGGIAAPPGPRPRAGGLDGFDAVMPTAPDKYGYRVDASRRRLRSYLASLDFALKGIDFRNKVPATGGDPRGLASQAKTPPEQKSLETLARNIERMIKKIENETEGLQNRKAYENELQAALDSLGKPGGAPAAAPMAPAAAAANGNTAPAAAPDPIFPGM